MAPVERMLAENNKETFIDQQLTQVKRNASRLLHLVSELMDFRKAETNNLQLHVARYNLVSFLQSIYDSLTELSIAKNITVSFSYNEADIPVYFDASQLEKVFLNLLTNAFKFTPNGGRIQVNIEQQKNNSVQISVTDNGRGIAPQYLDKLFNNFFQAADHGVQNTGYGIGLALSKHIVELHKGTITVYSEPAGNDKEGKTCFTVTLLQGNSHFTADQLSRDTSSAETNAFTGQVTATNLPPLASNTETIAEKTGTILIAEDNPELRKIIIETFAGTYNVLSCENGSQAWETAIENIPDIIVSDVMMPEMDGFNLCTKLKSDERSSHIPVILLTAKSSQNDQVSGLETGADMYITKPFSTKFLELAVRNTLASRERMRQQLARHLQEQSPAAGFECASEDVSNTVDKEFLNKVILLVHEHMDNADFGVEMLSRKVAMSAPVLYRKINALTGMSVNDFIKSLRLKKAAELLSHGKHTVYEVAYSVGYNDRKYFSKEFKKKYGKTPSEWVNQ
jgi:DNA-binding response OmpR family regulator